MERLSRRAVVREALGYHRSMGLALLNGRNRDELGKVCLTGEVPVVQQAPRAVRDDATAGVAEVGGHPWVAPDHLLVHRLDLLVVAVVDIAAALDFTQ